MERIGMGRMEWGVWDGEDGMEKKGRIGWDGEMDRAWGGGVVSGIGFVYPKVS
jgi:hypothetical protein